MTEPIPKEYLSLLKNFIDMCIASPSLLHDPSLKFFKDYLQSLGAKIPEPEAAPKPSMDQSSPKSEASADTEGSGGEHKSSSEEMSEDDVQIIEESEESEVELDNSGVVELDNGEPLPQGNDEIEVTDEMMELSMAKRAEAAEALSEGNLDKAVDLFTEAIMNNPQVAATYAKRAGVLLQMGKINAALADCNKALQINPDQALAYKYRGRAYRLLGQWENAARDLALACRIDYSEEADMWLKEVMPNVKKIQEHRCKYEQKQKEKEIRELEAKRERYKKAKEKASRTQAEESAKSADGMGSGFFGMPGCSGFGPNEMRDLLTDPELAEAFKDAEVAAALEDITKDPKNISKYYANEKVGKVLSKILDKFNKKDMSP